MYTLCLIDIEDAIFWPDSSCYMEINSYLEIGLPCAFLGILEGGAMHLMTFISGYLGVTE